MLKAFTVIFLKKNVSEKSAFVFLGIQEASAKLIGTLGYVRLKISYLLLVAMLRGRFVHS